MREPPSDGGVKGRMVNLQEQIRQLREDLDARIDKLDEARRQLQLVCLHIGATQAPRSDTGNWCKSDDRYWYECSCPDCGLWWTRQ